MSDDNFQQHARAHLAAALARRSTQYRWFWDNWDWFQTELRKTPHPDWDAFAEAMGKLGITNARGGAPTASTTRQTYGRIKKLKLKQTEPDPPDQETHSLDPRTPVADLGGFSLRSQKPKG
jgi:hypothetical protein